MENNSKILTIHDVFNQNKISTRTYNICKYNGILNIDDLIQYYEKYRTFRNIRTCGKGSEIELEKLLKSNIDIEKTISKDTIPTIYQAFLLNEISRRFFKICNNNRILTIYDLINYYTKDNTFATLQECGPRISVEMESFCNKYKKLPIIKIDKPKVVKPQIKKNKKKLKVVKKKKQPIKKAEPIKKTKKDNADLVGIINKLNDEQLSIINEIIYIELSYLSLQLRKNIYQFMGHTINIKVISDKIFSNKEFRFNKIPNINNISIKIFEEYITKIKDLTIKVSLRDNLTTNKEADILSTSFNLDNI
jgi:hypothetical protein